MPLKYRKCLLLFQISTAGNVCIHCFKAESTRLTEPFPGLVHYQEEQIKENQTQSHNKPKGLNAHFCYVADYLSSELPLGMGNKSNSRISLRSSFRSISVCEQSLD